jgi:hypothetical protein
MLQYYSHRNVANEQNLNLTLNILAQNYGGRGTSSLTEELQGFSTSQFYRRSAICYSI